jgi:type IV pilus assembly protein PilC
MPNTAVKMIEAGEASGQLDEILLNIAAYFEGQLDHKISRSSALFEPLMMLVIGIFVGGIIITMYLPIFSIVSVIK